jgi:hypothetical protein
MTSTRRRPRSRPLETSVTAALTSSVTYVSPGISWPVSPATSSTAASRRGWSAASIRGPGDVNGRRRGTIATRIEHPVTRPKIVIQTFPRPASTQPKIGSPIRRASTLGGFVRLGASPVAFPV